MMKVSPAAFMAFILLIAISGRNVHTTGQRRPSGPDGGPRASGHSGRSHQTGHAGTSNDESRRFWTSAERITTTSGFDDRPVVRLVYNNIDLLCLGSLAQLTSEDVSFIAMIIPWECYEEHINNQPQLVRAVDLRDNPVMFDPTPIASRSGIDRFAVFRVTHGQQDLHAVPVAKAHMPRDGTIRGITATGENGPQLFRVVTRDRCGIRQEDTLFCAWLLGDLSGEMNVPFGAPFFIKSSGQLYLAGLHVEHVQGIPGNDVYNVGGYLYEMVNEERIKDRPQHLTQVESNPVQRYLQRRQ